MTHPFTRKTTIHCVDCGRNITQQERDEYGNRCYSHGEDAVETTEENRRRRIAIRNEY